MIRLCNLFCESGIISIIIEFSNELLRYSEDTKAEARVNLMEIKEHNNTYLPPTSR